MVKNVKIWPVYCNIQDKKPSFLPPHQSPHAVVHLEICTKALLRDQGGLNPDCRLLTEPGVEFNPESAWRRRPFLLI